MKISRFMMMTVFGLGLISQMSFAVNSTPRKTATSECGVGCHRSIFPLFNKRENRPCKCEQQDETKKTKRMIKKTTKTRTETTRLYSK